MERQGAGRAVTADNNVGWGDLVHDLREVGDLDLRQRSVGDMRVSASVCCVREGLKAQWNGRGWNGGNWDLK